ncbi:MAG: 23S rRNA (adenine(1618)-N(6))-methyltransferase RlmF [Sporocytophaga sp.]|uniref:23S rRNA (adenine(1618)-N(6))-methyltransferase RlmF n=1 Tax=Sporocytophaga sp. TaxID=2231183 RepID=UPI001B29DE05|nr:23S rRNA (adenine(1618)-N(6))-methyltransferase RlmF [Sporocytophaga sp.]MBO9701817.1 23S rRNA (adenine(1618)-N(6))-methyltransferase RlmF [Sporocytophaga sp.]
MKSRPIVEKNNLHPRNQHRLGYNFEELIAVYPELQNFVMINEHAIETIDFSNPQAVKALNKALLFAYYGIKYWDIPENYLCPPIPGRVDYIHYLADLLASNNNGIIPQGKNVQVLDIGTGANCIYPILGNAVYDWSFVGTDIDEKALMNCEKIIKNNPQLMDAISLQQQIKSRFIFKNIITAEDKFALTICNPPFHNSAEEARKNALRKISNLKLNAKNSDKAVLNFGGQNAELWCEGGELGFIAQMINESVNYPMQCLWFTTLVSKKENLSSLYKILNKVNSAEVKTIDMSQGQKISRILAWTFHSKNQQKNWKFGR